MEKNKYLISVVEASKKYGFPRDKLYSMITNSKTDLPYIKINGRVKINVPMFEEWLNKLAMEQKELNL